ncbi:MAG TPA: hypothetical protein VNL98_07045 [Gemmatimonadales bacterium]|nr:hypothetical protein [Gemmatimonadales bacterium]
MRRVRAAANRGELELAERTCILALERFPHSPELLLLHGFLLGEAGRYQEAANSLRAVVYLDRQLAVAHLALGVVLARLGMPEAARRALRNADRILSAVAPDDPVPLSDGEPASRLKEMGRVRLSLLMAR